MLYTSFCGCVWEEPGSSFQIRRQCAALYFCQILLAISLHIEIESGIPKGKFRLHHVKIQSHEILLHKLIGHKAVYIDPFQPRLIDGDQVIGRLPVRIRRLLQRDLCAGKQKLPQAAGILDMDLLFFPSISTSAAKRFNLRTNVPVTVFSYLMVEGVLVISIPFKS